MNEYAASYSRIEKIVKAAQSIRDSLVCSICLELFNEPVIIKCGHKFCKSCILKVANNENAACPYCNLKIQKRSIPKDTIKELEACVEKFNALVIAIFEDSGIDVLQPYNKVKHTKESVTVNEKLDTSKFEVASVASFSGFSLANQSIRSKLLPSNASKSKRFSLRKQKQPSNDLLKTPSTSTKNTLHKYLSARTDNESDQVQPNEKVSNWLKNVTPIVSDSTHTDSDIDDVPSTSKNNEEPNIEKSPFTLLKEDYEDSLPKTYSKSNRTCGNSLPSKNQEYSKIDESRFKEVQLRVQEAETMARRKKLSQTTPENILKTPSCIPATAHSDAGDWRRVRKVGKEMQVKTFKSLHVSVEKNCLSAVVLEESNDSGINDAKNISKESDTKGSCRDPVDKRKHKKIKKTDSSEDKKNPQSDKRDYKYGSTDSTPSIIEENVSASYLDENRVKETTGVTSKNSSNASQKNKNVSSTADSDTLSSKIKKTDGDSENNDLDQSSNAIANSNLLSPTKRKISLKLKTSANSRTSSSPKTPVKQLSDLPVPVSPERPKSRLSLRLPSKINESPVKKTKTVLQPSVKSPGISPIHSPVKFSTESLKKTYQKSSVSQRNSDSTVNKPSNSSSCKFIAFRKLGRICKRRKVIPFLKLGKIKPKLISSTPNESASGIVVTSIVPVQVDYKTYYKTNLRGSELIAPCQRNVKIISPEEDSQLKFLNLESPDRLPKGNKIVKENVALVTEENCPSEEMEIDESPKKDKSSRRRLSMEKVKTKKEVIPNSQESKSSGSTLNKTVIEVIDQKSDTDVPNSPLRVVLEEEDQSEAMETSDNKSLKSSKSSKKQSNPVKEMPVEDDIMSVSSNESGRRRINTRSRRKFINKYTSEIIKEFNKNSEVESVGDSDSLIYNPKAKGHEREKSVSVSSGSTPIRISSLKKKRMHTDSSNDEDDVTSIIGKWCDADDGPMSKKARVLLHKAQVHTIVNQEDGFTSDEYVRDVEHDVPVVEPIKPLARDSPIDDIINQVKASKEKEMNANKLHNMPSSLNSADLFDTNDQSIIMPTGQRLLDEPNAEVAKRVCSSSDSSPSKNSDKENVRKNSALDTTIVDKNQFKANKMNISEKSDNSDKENDLMASPLKNEINMHHVRESLLNVTQENENIKHLEKNLFGFELSAVKHEEKFSTPTKKKETVQQESEFETDNIDATPVVKKRPVFNFLSKKNPVEDPSEYELSLPERNPNVIPAITPMKNRTSYPLCHSTPMAVISPLKETAFFKNITMVCSGLSADNVKTVQEFGKRFRAKFKSNFTTDVTHVIVNTNPELKLGQKTSKYIQGIAFKKYVVSFLWIEDCLKQNKLLDEDDEKYDVLDPDTYENGAKKSRTRVVNIFADFAVYCLDPFTSLPLEDFKKLLRFNGAIVTNTPGELAKFKDKYRFVILESEDLNPWQIELLKKSKGALISFEWVVDSISQYTLVSAVPYLFETTIEEALALEIPPELLVIEEPQEEDD